MPEEKIFNGSPDLDIAVIGMAGRFPGAKDINEFWNNLQKGIESLSFFADEELKEGGVSPGLLEEPNYVKTGGGVLEGKECFDASFFDYSANEAEVMPPAMRIFHECSWHALEHAGYHPGYYNGVIGLYAGASASSYWEALVFSSGRNEILGNVGTRHLTYRDFFANRIAYKLNLKGPALTVQTGCSTSLVAVHLACQAILGGECDMALAGGVTLLPEEVKGYLYQEGMIFSPDGHCRAFDARARGVVHGSGAGVVILKRLSDAIADGDCIHALIKGTAVNNDGTRKVGFTAPSVDGQAEVIKMALQVADVAPESISYVETHGTGTALGDPVEIEGLRLAFNTDKKKFCGIGSVKTNIGHLDTAAGIAGLIKTILALQHRLIPPSLNFETPNPKINFENSPFYVNTMLNEWKSHEYPLRAGVSSFGIGGTNAHVILEEASAFRGQKTDDRRPMTGESGQSQGRGGVSLPRRSRKHQLILLSAKTEFALQRMTENLVNHFKNNPNTSPADAAYTLQVGRSAFPYRKMLMCSEIHQGVEALSSSGLEKVSTSWVKKVNRPIIFMFPGQGAQYVNMGLELYQTETMFREEMDRCFEILKPLMGYDIKEILYPSLSVSSVSSVAKNRINRTEIAQPLLFVFEYALAKLLIKWGSKPYAMIGHSIGEYVSACLSGVFMLEDALKLVVSRGQLMQKMPPGGMMGAALPEAELIPLLKSHKEIALAAVNSPSNCVVSGPFPALETLEKQLLKKGIKVNRLHTSHAFHSSMMDPILKDFASVVGQVPRNKPRVPFISNTTGKWISPEETVDPSYWSRHLRQTVRFADGIGQLLKKSDALFLEVGPGKTLSSLVRQHGEKKDSHQVLNLIRHSKEQAADEEFLLERFGQMWLYGQEIDWNAFHADTKKSRIPLPLYSFDKERYWIQGDPFKKGTTVLDTESQYYKKSAVTDFFYVPLWKQTATIKPGAQHIPVKGGILAFIDRSVWGDVLIRNLKTMNYRVIIVEKGEFFIKTGPGAYRINPGNSTDYQLLVKDIAGERDFPQIILHMWNVTVETHKKLEREGFEKAQYLGFYSLVFLVQAIKNEKLSADFYITILSNNLQKVTGGECVQPEKSTVLGLVKVLPQEFPNISCRSIDMVLPPPGSWEENKTVQQLLAEILTVSQEGIVAYRCNRRWIQTFEAVKLEEKEGNPSKPPLRKGGVYLVTGGLGRIGLVLAQYLARYFEARLILVGRSDFPPPEEWDQRLNRYSPQDDINQKILKIREIEAVGGQVKIFSANTADISRMKAVIWDAEAQLGPINGVIHAAGVTRGHANHCALEEISTAVAETQFQPKVYGLLVLAELFKEKNLDFCLLTSSLASVLGGLGFAVYSAANIFMDTYIHAQAPSGLQGWISVNWDGWNLDEHENPDPTRIRKQEQANLTLAEGQQAFERILAWGEEKQVVVSTRNLEARIRNWIKLAQVSGTPPPDQQEMSSLKHRPSLTTAYVSPRTHMEKRVSQIWKRFFGFDNLGVRDDFFELGGDSLKVINMASLIHKELEVEIPLAVFFNSPTIEGLVRYIDRSGSKRFVSIEPVEKKEYYALSSAQKRLYIMHEMAEPHTAYNMPRALTVKGHPDQNRLEKVFRELIRRHDSLQTYFLSQHNEPVQAIAQSIDIQIPVYEYPPGTGNLESIIDGFIKPFDLRAAPLVRVGVIRISSLHHLLLFDIHHIVADGLSMGILIREFVDLYQGKGLNQLTIQYKDFSEWQIRFFESPGFRDQENYWKQTLGGKLPVLDMPLDFVRPAQQSFEGCTVTFSISSEQVALLERLSKEQSVTVNILILSIYSILLAKYSNQEDIIVGSLVAGRRHTDLDPVIGMFGNFLPLCIRVASDLTFLELLQNSKNVILDAYENQDYPFEKMIDLIHYPVDLSRNPLFDTMLIFHNEADPNLFEVEIDGLAFSSYPFPNKTSKLDFKIDINPVKAGHLNCHLEYDTRLFSGETIKGFIKHFILLIETLVRDPGQKISWFHLFSEEEKKALEAKRKSHQPQVSTSIKLIICSTFTADPVIDYITWWCRQFHLEVDVFYTSYNQVFQELLDENSPLTINNGVNVLFIRFEDWLRDIPLTDHNAVCEKLEMDYLQLVNILEKKKMVSPYFFGIFPIASHLSLAPPLTEYLGQLTGRWVKFIKQRLNNAFALDFTPLDRWYNIEEVFDPVMDKEGHLPFSDQFYAAMGTLTARKVIGLYNQPFKVIVLDCDNTLWDGVCGEDGALGVRVEGPYLELQRFMDRKYKEGFLLALCSKNNEADVWEVFEKNPRMLLTKKHLVTWQINWNSKTENIKKIASQLNLGLDNFVFIDDSPVECAEVMANLPEVLTLKLPQEPKHTPAFLNHVWALDKIVVTDEDQYRTSMYQAEERRKKSENQSPALKDFLAQLGLKVSINPMKSSQVTRVSQLTQRTNQFNLSTQRRTEEEIIALTGDQYTTAWVVEVTDRFGDYGLVGVVISRVEQEELFLETFLLSCRVLGKGVEQAVLAGLKRYCRVNGLAIVIADYYPTPKNKPVLDFFKQTWQTNQKGDGNITFRLEAERVPESPPFIDLYYLCDWKGDVKETIPPLDACALDHIAVAVGDIRQAKTEYRKKGFQCSDVIYDPLQRSRLVICRKTGYDAIELVAAVDQYSPTHRLVKENGDIPYHLCFCVKDIGGFVKSLQSGGISFEAVSDLKPAKLFHHRQVMFISVHQLGLIELLEDKDMDLAAIADEKVKRSTLQIITAAPGPSLSFFKQLGYLQVKNTHNDDRVDILLEKGGAGRLQLIIPRKEDTEEQIFLEKNGTHPYRIILADPQDQRAKTGHARGEDANRWQVLALHREKLLHNNQLLALEYDTAEKLLTLPTFEVDYLISSPSHAGYTAPRDEIEKKLVNIWQEILKVEKISIDATFFQLGGNSVKALLLVSRLHKAFRVILRLGDIFKNPTVRKLAKVISGRGVSTFEPIRPAEKCDYYRLSFAQKRIYIVQQMQENSTAYNIPMTVRLVGRLERERLENSFHKLIQRHEALRTAIIVVRNTPVQKIYDEAAFKVEYYQSPEEESEVVVRNFVRPFDLRQAPLFRGGVVKVGEQTHLLIVDINHIISDGVSLNVLVKDFMTFYRGEDLPPLDIHYKDFVVWQNRLYETGLMKNRENYWLEQFMVNIPELNLSTDYDRPRVRSVDDGDLITFTLENTLRSRIYDVLEKTGATLFAFLLAAYNVLLFKYTGKEDIVVGSSVTGRTHADLEDVIGVFVNMLSMRNQPQSEKTFRHFLAEITENTIQALENQDYPFDMLVNKLGLLREASRNPLFDTEFAMHNMDIPKLEIPGLTLEAYGKPHIFSKFDLHFLALENNDKINIILRYYTAIFKKSTIETMAEHYIEIIQQVVDNPELKLKDIVISFDVLVSQSSILEEARGDFGL